LVGWLVGWLVDVGEFEQQSGALVVNVARGPIVEYHAMLGALNSGKEY
jgi:phosphoglycerate dehydrogenase-like enzyme